jgi:protein-disulfide isomerase-like protein with CxxC motif
MKANLRIQRKRYQEGRDPRERRREGKEGGTVDTG